MASWVNSYGYDAFVARMWAHADEKQIDQSLDEGSELFDYSYDIVWFKGLQIPEKFKIYDKLENESDCDSNGSQSLSLDDEDD